MLVAVLIVSGLTNSWFLVGLDHLGGLWTTNYGRLLLVKLVCFLGMLGLAAANRFWHTRNLGAALEAADAHDASVGKLRRSLIIEALLGFSVLALVAWFGMLEPPSAG